MAKQTIQDKINSAFDSTKTLYKFNLKNGWFYVHVSPVANSINIVGTEVLEISGFVQAQNTVKELAMLVKDVYLFGRDIPADEKEKPTCYFKNVAFYGDIFIAFKNGKKLHPVPFTDAITNIEKLQFAKKSQMTITVTMI